MKLYSKKILCMVLSLALFAEPIPAFAYGVEESIVARIGNSLQSELVIDETDLNATAMHINDIPYKGSADQQGNIIVYTGDLQAALTGDLVQKKNSGVIKADDLLITNCKLVLNEVPGQKIADPVAEMRKGYYAISGAAFTQDQIAQYSPIIDEALDELSKLIDTLESDVRDELRKLFDDADAKKSFDYFANNPKNAMWRFRIGMRDVYSFLFDMRTTLAEQATTKDVSASLNKIEGSKLMQAMKNVLQQTFDNTMYTDFWTDDAAWDSYSKHYVLDKELGSQRISSIVGGTFDITDNTGRKIELQVTDMGTTADILERTVIKTVFTNDIYSVSGSDGAAPPAEPVPEQPGEIAETK